MTHDNKKKDDSLGAEIVEGLTDLCEHMESGRPVEEKFTVRTVALDLKPQEYEADDVKLVRRSLNVSQGVFAQILATSVECIENWEQGLQKPPPMACRLLDLVNRHRDHWIKVLSDARQTQTPA